ncbi:MAG: chemotaxis protein CheX [Bilophila sp.]
MPSGVEIAKPFVQATIHVLSCMAGLTPTPGAPYVKKNSVAQGDVSAIVGVTGDKAGSISVTFSKACAIALVRGMLGDDIQDILQDTKDAVGEITNMISGQARGGLAEMGMSFQGSTPSVIMGDNHTLSHITKGPVIAIPFQTEHGEFTLEFSFDS